MNAPLDVVCAGEALVDFLPEKAGLPVSQVERWQRFSGGSPANVAVGLARLGARAGFVGVVGRDPFGDFLRDSLAAEGVDVSRMRQTDEGKTGLVFISLDARGDRSFAMFRTRSAELFFDQRDVDPELIASARAVHCGSNSLRFPPAQEAMVAMLETARRAGRIVSCDPNLRLHFWPDPRELRAVLDRLVPCCSVVKLSEDEFEFVTGEKTPEAALTGLAGRGVALPVVTLAERGALALWRGRRLRVAAPAATVVDTTGAGDGFVSALLYCLTRLHGSQESLLRASPDELEQVLAFACAVGSRAVEGFGAVSSLPRLGAVRDLLPAFITPSKTGLHSAP